MIFGNSKRNKDTLASIWRQTRLENRLPSLFVLAAFKVQTPLDAP